jgi:NAD(P)H-hydrate epimerase
MGGNRMASIRIITVGESRDLENAANAGGLSFAEMMENAGRRTAEAIRSRMGVKGRRVVVLVGPGNNGGDGLVAAHYLSEMGADVTCYVWKRDVDGDGNYSRASEDGLRVLWAEDDCGYASLFDLVSGAHVLVDALLGVGVTRPIEGTLEELLHKVRQALEPAASSGLADTVPSHQGRIRPLVVAVDCPTGLDCDTGGLDPAALYADLTVSFAHAKRGLLRFPGAEAVGDLVVADIAIPAELARDIPLEMASPELIRSWLPQRPRSAHKGTFGRVLIVAGSVNYVGAAVLAGAAATRVGAGLVTMGLPMPVQPAVAAHLTEATYLLLPHDMGVTASGAVGLLSEKMGDYEALLVGPGLTQETETVTFVHELLSLEPSEPKGRMGFVGRSSPSASERPGLPPLVIDADGLNALALSDRWWSALPPDTILTPHPGEMARLMGGEATVQEIQANREECARNMAREWGAVVVLKGAFTVVASPGGRVVVVPFANPGLASAGSGDVLAGAIVGLRTQGMAAYQSAVAGAYLHGLAGELVRSELGDMGMVAGDLPMRLPLALRRVRQGE